MTKLDKIDKPASLAEIAYVALRESILTFKLVPGTIYNEAAVAADLGLSRTPVREALLRLSSQGLVTFLPRKGFELVRYTPKDVEEIFELRQTIETAVLRKITRRVSDLETARLEEALAMQRAAAARGDAFAFMNSDRVFHNLLCEFADNSRLMSIAENFQDLCHLMGTRALTDNGRMAKAIIEHEMIVSAIRQKDPEKAARFMRDHLEKIRTSVLEAFQE
jgi:DNA-binding GntR family transcriptional regulator